ncbi:MAG: PCMD domain-containing protein [Candidatus Cryptobacteroides sp.]|nr:PCMD domain-containing protein [Bacteroidales bacterium]MDY5743194.1 PCMD domain-containing protein [Candidatus Cryptobacteroides sp.]
MRFATGGFAAIFAAASFFMPAKAQDCSSTVRDINRYGTFDHWTVREIKESGIIGGRTKYLYEFFGSPADTIRYDKKKSKAFRAPEAYLWRSNNVYANVMGIEKCSVTDFPEKRGDGWCCRLEVHVEDVKVAGMINMDVVCQGAFLLGSLPEPIKDTKDPMAKPLYGIPFTGRPSALQFDYKAKVGCEIIRGNGFSKLKTIGGRDHAEVAIILQKRWEDEQGNVHALRVGTGIERITSDVPDWVNGHRIPVHYGDISGESWYKDYMKLLNGTPMDLHCINSKGKNVKIVEEGWADENETPNVLIIRFLASCGEAFYGGVGNTLWIDNVKLIM